MEQSQSTTFLKEEAKAWLNRADGSSEVIRVVPDDAPFGHQRYELYTAYDWKAQSLGTILFDAKGYWIYDGCDLSVSEQEQVAAFIMRFEERI